MPEVRAEILILVILGPLLNQEFLQCTITEGFSELFFFFKFNLKHYKIYREKMTLQDEDSA